MPQIVDQVVRAMLDDGSFRIIVARTTSTVAGTIGAQQAKGMTARYVGSLITGAILFRETMAPGYRVQAILRGTDEKSALVADSHPSGDARALVQLAKGTGEISIGKGAHLQMMRSLPNGAINQGVVELPDSGDLSDAVMAYMESSEQVRTVVKLSTRIEDRQVVAAGGFMVQLLPEARREHIEVMIEHLESLGEIDDHVHPDFTPHDLIQLIVRDRPYTLLGDTEVRYGCWCSEVRVMGALATLERKEIEEMISGGEPIELSCDYCNTTYRIPPVRLQGLLRDS